MDIKIIQWNGQSVTSHKPLLEIYLGTHQPHIILLSETWFRKNHVIKFHNYRLIRSDRADGYGGSAILIANHLNFQRLDVQDLNNDNMQLCAVRININSQVLDFASVYIKPGQIIGNLIWNTLKRKLSDNFMIGGDFNAHSGVWGCAFSDRAGHSVLDAVDTHNMYILNDCLPTIVTLPGRRPSTIDLTICCQNLAPYAVTKTTTDTLGSNHFVITTSLHITSSTRNTHIVPSKLWNTKRADWTNYAKYIEDNLIEITQDMKMNAIYTNLISTIEQAANQNIPKKTPYNSKHIPKSWWNTECQQKLAIAKQQLSKYRRESNLDNFIAYKRATNLAKKFIKNKKRSEWKNFCNSLDLNTPSAVIWKSLRKVKNINVETASENHMISDSWLEDYADSLAPQSSLQSPFPEETIANNNHFLLEKFVPEELDSGLKKNSTDTAPGPDNITYSMIKHLPKKAKDYLLYIYNNIWYSEEWITDWQKQIVIPILKSGKDPGNISSYRPISLSSCIFKVLERLIKNRLEWFLEHKQLLPNNQTAYRKSKSTYDAIFSLNNEIQRAFQEKSIAATVFLDISKAYDSVQLPVLLRQLATLNIPDNFIIRIEKMFRCREIVIKFKSKISTSRSLFIGLQQGSILSPLLFNVYTADLGNYLPPTIHYVQYADDIIMINRNNKVTKCIQELKHAFFGLDYWLNSKGFKLSDSKSSILFFTHKRIAINQNEIRLGLHNIPVKATTKYLGMFFDQKLTWKCHISHLQIDIEKRLNILRAIAYCWWGANPNVMLMFYKAYIRAKIDYGSIFYSSATSTNLKTIDKLQYKCLRLCIGAMKSTPINSLLAETCEPPLQYRRAKLGYNFILKKFYVDSTALNSLKYMLICDMTSVRGLVHKPPQYLQALGKLMDLETEMKQDTYCPQFKYPYEIQQTNVTLIIPHYTDNPGVNKIIFQENLDEHVLNYTRIYTDGSKNNTINKVGAAFYSETLNVERKIPLPENFSSFTAELIAIKEALNYILEHNDANAKFVIISDCMSALQYISNNNKPSYDFYLQQIRYSITKVLKFNSLKFMWIKSHQDIAFGNTKADALAKEASIDVITDNIYKTPQYDLISLIQRHLHGEWQLEWQQNRGTHYGTIEQFLPKKPWFFKNSKPRKTITSLCRIRFGHASYPQHLNKIGVFTSPNCPCDNTTVGSLDHIFLFCPLYINQRTKLIFNLQQLNFSQPFNLQTILKNQNSYKYLSNFLNNIELNL